MEKLYIWYNPNTHSFYQKICRNCGTRIGSYNQYDHLLCYTLTKFDNTIHSNLTNYQCYKIMAKKRNKRYSRLFNRYNLERSSSQWEKHN